MGAKLDSVIEEMITGAMNSVEPSAITKKLYERAKANHRKQARRVLEKVALVQVRGALHEAEQQLADVERSKSAHDEQAAEVARLGDVVATLSERHDTAVEHMRSLLGDPGGDDAAAEVLKVRMLLDAARDEHAAAVECLNAVYFDSEQHADLVERVGELKRASASGDAALKFQAPLYSGHISTQAQRAALVSRGFFDGLARKNDERWKADVVLGEYQRALDAQRWDSPPPKAPSLNDVLGSGG